MQLIGIVLLLLVGLSGSRDVLGKKRAWLPPLNLGGDHFNLLAKQPTELCERKL